MTISVGYITTNEDIPFLLYSLESIEPYVDEIIIIQNSIGNNTIKLLNYIGNKPQYKHVLTKYSGTNGSEYNKILPHVTSEWLLILDADEVPSDNIYSLKEYTKGEKTCYSIRMNHLVYDLAHLDNSLAGDYTKSNKQPHYVLNRFFKVKPGIKWEGKEHSTITGFKQKDNGLIDDIIIWHYSKCKDFITHMKSKYEMNLSKSTIHNKDYLDGWYYYYILGQYPKGMVNVNEHPSVIRREYYINNLKGGNVSE